jgi:hypothetical protein
MKTRK